MSNSSNSDYLFASAYIQSHEKHLLSKERIERMLSCKTSGDVYKVLSELKYWEGEDSGFSGDPEPLLFKELEKAYQTVLSLVQDPMFFAAFIFPYEYHNIKVLLKAEHLGLAAESLLINIGTIPTGQLAEMVRNKHYLDMRDEMRQGLHDAIDVFNVTHDPQLLDSTLDKACYKDIIRETSSRGIPFLNDYVTLKIDTINLKSFVRARCMKKTWDFFAGIYIPGGTIPSLLFTDGYDDAFEQFADKLVIYGGLQSLLLDSLPMLKETGNLTSMERLSDNLLMSFIRDHKHITFGIQPIISYIAAKENEIQTIRIIMTGKLSGIPTEQIKERISITYA